MNNDRGGPLRIALQTFAGLAVGGGLVAVATDTLVRPLQIDAAAAVADPGENTLVDIWSQGQTAGSTDAGGKNEGLVKHSVHRAPPLSPIPHPSPIHPPAVWTLIAQPGF